MTHALMDDDGWSGLLSRLSSALDVAASAREHGAFLRARAVGCAADLLRLALVYGGTELSLRGTAAWSEAAGVARLSDVALLGRLQASQAWLGAIVQALLAQRVEPVAGEGGRRVRLVDASTVVTPDRTSWRLHADYDLGRGGFVGLCLSDRREAESLQHFAVQPGDVLVADRYYAKARQLAHVVAGGGDFLVRYGLTSCRLLRGNGEPLKLDAVLAQLGYGKTRELAVLVAPPQGSHAPPLRARLVIRHLGPKAAEARRRCRLKAARKSQPASDRRLKAAESVVLLTSLDAEAWPAARVLQLYRLRWQIELAFKRLKSLAGLAEINAKEPRLVSACLYANLILALIGEQMVQQVLDSPPWHNQTAITLAADAADA